MAVQSEGFLVASDIGGTFTDTVVLDGEGAVSRYKSPTVPHDVALGVVETLRLAAEDRGWSLGEFAPRVGLFAHGTTVATNAMIQGRRAPVGLIQTRGFGDTIAIMRGFKSLGLDEDRIKDFRGMVKQPLITPKHLIGEVSERVDYRGRVVIALDGEDAREAVRRLAAEGAETFAVSLLWSFKNDSHERRLAEIIEEEVPGALISLSCDLLPRIGELARSVTVAINAGLRPAVREAAGSIAARLEEHGARVAPLLMQSNGGLHPAADIDRQAASIVMSGPVGGVIACQYIGGLIGRRNLVTTAMGGTSFDVGMVLDGLPLMSNVTEIGRDTIALPSVSVRTVGAGSGSIARVDRGLLRVGPDSAGAVPGPACYGRGGTLPTVADADLVLGYTNPENFLGGRLRLDVVRARAAIEEHVARPLGMAVEAAAEGIRTIIDSRMADLIRQVTVEQGFDPADFTLVAFGGAGPTHATHYGAELGIAEIVVPITASVHSAFGILSSDLTVVEETSHPLQSPPGSTDYESAIPAGEVRRVFEELERRAGARLAGAGVGEDARMVRFVEMRFRFQIHSLTVPVPDGPIEPGATSALVERFIDLYEGRFGRDSAFKAAGVELLTFRVVGRGALTRPDLSRRARDGAPPPPARERQVYRRGQWRPAAVVRGEDLSAGATLDGLAVIELPDTTIVVDAGQRAAVDELGNLVISGGR